MSTLNTFQYQAAEYLGITGQAQAEITSTLYMPTISGVSTITVNGATGYKNNTGMCWGTADATLANGVTGGRFVFTFPTSYYTDVPAVVYSVNGNDDADSTAYVSGNDTANDDATITVVRSTTTGAANLKISWIAQSQD